MSKAQGFLIKQCLKSPTIKSPWDIIHQDNIAKEKFHRGYIPYYGDSFSNCTVFKSYKTNISYGYTKTLISDKLPERNELCICGSGIKFKKCCLTKYN
jgi:hypothetical protein